MEAGVSLTTATKVCIARSFVILEPRRCDEHRPQSRVQPQQKQWKSDSEVSEGYRTKSCNIPSEPPTQIAEGSPRQHSTGVEQRKKNSTIQRRILRAKKVEGSKAKKQRSSAQEKINNTFATSSIKNKQATATQRSLGSTPP